MLLFQEYLIGQLKRQRKQTIIRNTNHLCQYPSTFILIPGHLPTNNHLNLQLKGENRNQELIRFFPHVIYDCHRLRILWAHFQRCHYKLNILSEVSTSLWFITQIKSLQNFKALKKLRTRKKKKERKRKKYLASFYV